MKKYILGLSFILSLSMFSIGYFVGSSKSTKITHEVVKQENTDVADSKNWHHITYGNVVYDVYTGNGQVLFHHWVEPKNNNKISDSPK